MENSGSCLPSLIAVAGRRKALLAMTVVTADGSKGGAASMARSGKEEDETPPAVALPR
jgi:hypothetical protein